jgi:putative ABC transport system permease protein
VSAVARSIRDAWRTLARAPGLVVASLLSLAVGIGANLTVFGVLRAIEFPILPYPDGSRLVQVDASNVARGAAGYPMSLADFHDVRRATRTLSTVAASRDVTVTLRGGSEPERIAGKRVTGDFFTTLGTGAALGRPIGSADAASAVVVLSDRLWRAQFSADPNVVGRTVQLDGQPNTVLGVMPPRFDESTDAWMPLGIQPATAPRDDRQYTVVARLAPNTSAEAARAELTTIARRLAADHHETNDGWELSPTPLARLRARESGGGWYQLQAAVGFLLLIAAANVANLLLARAVARRREMAIRTALGATRWQRFRLVMAEGIVLAASASVAAGVLSVWGIRAVTTLAGLPPSVHVPIDAITVAAGVALVLIVAFLIAVAPAAFAARMHADTALRESGARGASASRGQRRLRNLLLYAEVAAALVLVTGASLMARTLWNRQQRDLGFDPRNALRADIALSEPRYDDVATLRSTVRELTQTVAGHPGVAAIGVSAFPFASRLGTPIELTTPGRSGDVLGPDSPRAIEAVSPGFFRAMATPLRRGRDITADDVSGAPLVAVVNEELARRAWPAGDAVGRTLRIAASDAEGHPATPTVTIVGIVASMVRSSMHDRVLPQLYVAYDQFPSRNVTLITRVDGTPERLVGGVKAAVRDVDARLFVENVRTLAAEQADFLRPTRLYAIMLQAFAALALLLAAVGIYASMAYSVAQRTRELAIRLALGADPAALVRRVLAEGLRIAVVGGALGVLLARAGGRVLRALVYGVETTDPLSFLGASALLVLVVVLGTWIPARRASTTDPAIALRVD